MTQLIAFLVLIFGFLGILVLVGKKLPELVLVSEEKKESYLEKLKRKIKEINPFKNFSLEIFLQKIVFQIRILSLKIDNLTFNWLRELRQKYQQRKQKEKDDYWEKIKTAKEK